MGLFTSDSQAQKAAKLDAKADKKAAKGDLLGAVDTRRKADKADRKSGR